MLAAVALQDHYIRNLSLSTAITGRHKVPKHRPKQWRKEAKPVVNTGRGMLLFFFFLFFLQRNNDKKNKGIVLCNKMLNLWWILAKVYCKSTKFRV